jgi:hypothetical protein
MLMLAGVMETVEGELLASANETWEAAGAESLTVPVTVVPIIGAGFGKASEMTGSGATVICAEPEV